MGLSSQLRVFSVVGLLLLVGCAKSDNQQARKDLSTGNDSGDMGSGGDQGVALDLTGVAPDPDLATPGKDAAAPGPCNVVTQTGCGDNQKCAYTDPTAGAVMTVCVNDGQELAGQQCNDGTNGDCLGSNLCVIEDEVGMINICRSWCDDDTDCTALGQVGPDNRGWCELPVPMYPSKLCTQPCNPVPNAGATGCQASLGCRYFAITRGTTKFEATHCAAVGAKVAGDDCTTTNECGGALVCVSVNSSGGKCRPVCRNQANGFDMKPDDCASGESCQGLDGVVDPFFGVCLPNA